MAIRDSVTVSIAELTSGTRRVTRRVSRADVSASEGTTSDSAGRSMTSSKVRPSSANFSGNPGSVSTMRSIVVAPPTGPPGARTAAA